MQATATTRTAALGVCVQRPETLRQRSNEASLGHPRAAIEQRSSDRGVSGVVVRAGPVASQPGSSLDGPIPSPARGGVPASRPPVVGHRRRAKEKDGLLHGSPSPSTSNCCAGAYPPSAVPGRSRKTVVGALRTRSRAMHQGLQPVDLRETVGLSPGAWLVARLLRPSSGVKAGPGSLVTAGDSLRRAVPSVEDWSPRPSTSPLRRGAAMPSPPARRTLGPVPAWRVSSPSPRPRLHQPAASSPLFTRPPVRPKTPAAYVPSQVEATAQEAPFSVPRPALSTRMSSSSGSCGRPAQDGTATGCPVAGDGRSPAAGGAV